MPTKSSPPSNHRPVVIAVIACLAVAVAAFLLMRGMDSPWGGKLGRNIFGPDVYRMTSLDAHRGLIQFYFDPTHPARAKMTIAEWARVGLRLSSTLVLVVALLGAATARWWAGWLVTSAPVDAPPSAAIPRWSWMVLLVALAVGGALRLPAAWQYVTYDEQDNMRRNYHGYLDFEKPGDAPKWVEAGFADAVWENERVNNPFFFSTLSQISQAGWRAITGAPRERFNLPALRLPSLVFGTAAIAAIWWMMNTLGLVRQAPWAASLMAVHALAMHHSVEARGYGLCLFLACLLPGMAWRVMRRGHARDWVVFGVVVFSCLFAYPGSLYYVSALNVFVAANLAWRWRKQGEDTARAGLARWFITNIAAGMAFLWIVAPAAPQAMAEFQEKFPMGNLGSSWAIAAFVTYATGLIGVSQLGRDGWAGITDLTWYFTGFPAFWPIMIVAVVFFPMLLLTGGRTLWKQDRTRALLLAVAALSGCLMFTHHRLVTGYSMYHWYIIYILPAVLAIEACGIVAVASFIAKRVARNIHADAIAAGFATGLSCWLLAIGFNWTGSHDWNDGVVSFPRQPPHGGWSAPAGQIERSEIPRGSSLWVTYKDGYLCRFRNHEQNAAAWDDSRVRMKQDWGKLPRAGK